MSSKLAVQYNNLPWLKRYLREKHLLDAIKAENKGLFKALIHDLVQDGEIGNRIINYERKHCGETYMHYLCRLPDLALKNEVIRYFVRYCHSQTGFSVILDMERKRTEPISSGLFSLHRCILEHINSYLRYEPWLNAERTDGLTPLMVVIESYVSISQSDVDTIRLYSDVLTALIQSGCDVEKPNSKGVSPKEFAKIHNDLVALDCMGFF